MLRSEGRCAHTKSGASQPFEDKNPLCEIWVDDQILTGHLDKETGVSDEGDAQLLTGGHDRLAGIARTPSRGRVSYQRAKLTGFST